MARKLCLVVVAVVLIVGSLPLIAQDQGPPFRIPDQWEMGCVSCHSAEVIGETLDVTLGKIDHPSITRSVTELPEGCTMCHRNGTLGPIVHERHFARRAADGTTMPCLACHAMDASISPVLKQSPKNW